METLDAHTHDGGSGNHHLHDSAPPSTDLRSSILSEISASSYTCLVCTDYVSPSSKIWSCTNCYRVFDLECIQDWAARGSSTQDDRSWRCPSCNFSHEKIPKKYTCWCGKTDNPLMNYLDPHSCGNQCSHPLSLCSHECTLTCHPGPHIETCTSLGPILKCDCGKNKKQLPCVLTPYDRGWHCENTCEDLLPCGLHKCETKCHSGFCGECEKTIAVKCYCGKSTDLIHCNERQPKRSTLDGTSWIGNFECNSPCSALLDCGIHKCLLECHSIDADCHKCPNSPKNLLYCPCGKSKIDDLLASPRTSCLDDVPTCNDICGKRLPCGHRCYWKCHTGECAPCYRSVDIDCKCGFTHYSIACGLNIQGYVPTCLTKCNAKFNCKRHYCTKRCCEYREVAFERSKLVKKQLRNNIITNSIVKSIQFEDAHTCDKICDQLLSCGKHKCKEICHPGPCKPCLESSSDDLICNCGKTIVPAPVRCGTKLPLCPYQCVRKPTCGHRAEPHHCHEDDISCPKCTMLVTKRCQCEKNNLVANVMCYQEIVSCFKVCGKPLNCGEHKCKKVCHKPNDCQKKCTEKCTKLKKCGHQCQQVCHYGKPCNESMPCKEKVIVTCKCGRRKQPLMCLSVSNMIREEQEKKKMIQLEHQMGNHDGYSEGEHAFEDDKLDIVEDEITPYIPCDESCEKERRNKLLFEALGLNPARTKETEISLKMRSVEGIYSPFVLKLYAAQPTWCMSIEDIFKQLLSETIESRFSLMSNSDLKQSYHFRPMKEVQRHFIHELAESWGLFSESHDREPKRSVFIKLLNTSKIPDILLGEAHKINQQYKASEKKKAAEKATALHLRENNIKNREISDKFKYYNGIIINDVFFGVTVETVDSAVYDLWNQISEESSEKLFPLIKNGKVEFIHENMYVFYGEDICMDIEDRLALEKQIRDLSDLFDSKVKERNLALKCVPAKIDIEEGIVIEIMKEKALSEICNADTDNNYDSVDALSRELDEIKIESTTVSSEWW